MNCPFLRLYMRPTCLANGNELPEPFNYIYHPNLVSELNLLESHPHEMINISVAEYRALHRVADNSRRKKMI